MDNNFEYEIIDGEVIITGYTDELVESIDIPEFIRGLPVTTLWYHSFSLYRHLLIL